MSLNFKSEQTKELFSAYGGAMLLSHLVEDMLKLYVGNLRHTRVNGYERFSIAELNSMTHEKRIIELGFIFRKSGTVMETRLHQLRKIRNLMSHDFIIQVGRSLETQEGVDQIIAMLNRITEYEASALASLQKQNRELIETFSDLRFDDNSVRGDSTYFSHVESSRLQRIISDIESYM